MIEGLEELTLRCPDEDARVQVREAIKCYEASAYRAAIVTVYMAVCFDLIKKLRVLADGGDGDAKAAESKLQALYEQSDKNDAKAISGLLGFERSLLELFRDKLDFFGAHEFEDLARLRADRNRCAHPTFSKSLDPYLPSAELARLHIRNALTIVLTQQPRQGRSALSSLQSLVMSGYFPDRLVDAVARLKAAELGQARPALVKGFIDDLVFGWINQASPYYQNINVLTAIDAVIELHRPEALPRLKINMIKLLRSAIDNQIQFGCVISLRVTDAGEAVPADLRSAVTIWLRDPKPAIRGEALSKALTVSWLRDEARKQIDTLSSEEIHEVKNGEVPDEMVERSASLYCTVVNWSEANSVAANCILPLVDRFSEAQIEKIFTAATVGSADLQGSRGFSSFIDALVKKSPLGRQIVEALLTKHGLERYINTAS